MASALLKALRAGETVELEGAHFVKADGPIEPGDWYIAERNTGPKLLTAASFTRWNGRGDSDDLPNSEGSSWINPVEPAYPYDTHECVKVTLCDL